MAVCLFEYDVARARNSKSSEVPFELIRVVDAMVSSGGYLKSDRGNLKLRQQ